MKQLKNKSQKDHEKAGGNDLNTLRGKSLSRCLSVVTNTTKGFHNWKKKYLNQQKCSFRLACIWGRCLPPCWLKDCYADTLTVSFVSYALSQCVRWCIKERAALDHIRWTHWSRVETSWRAKAPFPNPTISQIIRGQFSGSLAEFWNWNWYLHSLRTLPCPQ